MTILLIWLVVIVMALGAAVQIVLWSDYPRRHVIQILQEQSGLVIHAKSLSTGWWGRSTLRDVTIASPLDARPFAQADAIDVRHRGLLPMMLGASADVSALELDHARVFLARNAAGEWNAVQAVARTLERQQRMHHGAGTSAGLPRLTIPNGTVTLLDADGAARDFALNFAGEPDGQLVWTFKARVPDVLDLDGRIVTSGSWQHRVRFELRNAQELAAALDGSDPGVAINAAGEWRGELPDGGLAGWVSLQDLSVGPWTVSGQAAVHAGAQGMAISTFTGRASGPHAVNVTLEGGSLRLRDQTLVADQLRVLLPQIALQASGEWNLQRRSGSARATWASIPPAASGLQHAGTIQASLDWPVIGPIRVAAHADSSGSFSGATWKGRIDVSAHGSRWTDMNAHVAFPALVLSNGQRTIDASGLTAVLSGQWPLFQLASVQIPEAQAHGEGTFDARTSQWSVNMAVSRWKPREVTEPLDVKLEAGGDLERFSLSTFRIDTPSAHVAASGSYDRAADVPLRADATINARLDVAAAASAHPQDGVKPTSTTPPSVVEASLAVHGSAQPLALALQATIRAADIPVAAGRLDRMLIPLQGRFDDNGLTLSADPAELLGGKLRVHGRYNPQTGLIESRIDASDLALVQIARLLDLPQEAVGSLSATLDCRMPALDPQAMELAGSFEIHDITAGAFAAEHGAGRLSMRAGLLNIDRAELQNRDGRIHGRTQFNTRTRRLLIDSTAEQWPVEVSGADGSLTLGGSAALDYDLQNNHASGTITLAGETRLGETPVGPFNASLNLHERTISLSQFTATAFGGQIAGSAVVPLDQWRTSRGSVEWTGVDLAQLRNFWPALAALSGTCQGTAVMQPALEPRAPEPMRLDLALQVEGGQIGPVSIVDLDVTGFTGPTRMLIDRSRLRAAEGTIDGWGRLTWHGSEPFTHLAASFQGLNLRQIAPLIDERSGDVAGVLSGDAAVGGYLRRPHRTFGLARVALRQTDLANMPLISALYSALSLQFGTSEPTGEGQATIRLEGDALELGRLEYFNRGTDIVARVRIADIWSGKDSPIDGMAVGAVRPLKNLNIPLFRDFDRALKALQSDAASVRITGTVGEREIKPVPFAEIRGMLRAILSSG